MHPYLTVPKAYFCYCMSGSYSLSCVLIRAHTLYMNEEARRKEGSGEDFVIFQGGAGRANITPYTDCVLPATPTTAAFLFTLTSSPFQMQFAAKLLLSLSRAPDNSQPPKSYIFQGCCSAWKPQGFQGFQEFPLLCYATAFCLSIRERGKPAL